jgi:hypothetical protein
MKASSSKDKTSAKYYFGAFAGYTLYQERGVFGKIKMDPAKRAQTQNAGEV